MKRCFNKIDFGSYELNYTPRKRFKPNINNEKSHTWIYYYYGLLATMGKLNIITSSTLCNPYTFPKNELLKPYEPYTTRKIITNQYELPSPWHCVPLVTDPNLLLDLPNELLLMIFGNCSLTDVHQFQFVCRRWSMIIPNMLVCKYENEKSVWCRQIKTDIPSYPLEKGFTHEQISMVSEMIDLENEFFNIDLMDPHYQINNVLIPIGLDLYRVVMLLTTQSDFKNIHTIIVVNNEDERRLWQKWIKYLTSSSISVNLATITFTEDYREVNHIYRGIFMPGTNITNIRIKKLNRTGIFWYLDTNRTYFEMGKQEDWYTHSYQVSHKTYIQRNDRLWTRLNPMDIQFHVRWIQRHPNDLSTTYFLFDKSANMNYNQSKICNVEETAIVCNLRLMEVLNEIDYRIINEEESESITLVIWVGNTSHQHKILSELNKIGFRKTEDEYVLMKCNIYLQVCNTELSNIDQFIHKVDHVIFLDLCANHLLGIKKMPSIDVRIWNHMAKVPKPNPLNDQIVHFWIPMIEDPSSHHWIHEYLYHQGPIE
jgi:hypothetical protein